MVQSSDGDVLLGCVVWLRLMIVGLCGVVLLIESGMSRMVVMHDDIYIIRYSCFVGFDYCYFFALPPHG